MVESCHLHQPSKPNAAITNIVNLVLEYSDGLIDTAQRIAQVNQALSRIKIFRLQPIQPARGHECTLWHLQMLRLNFQNGLQRLNRVWFI